LRIYITLDNPRFAPNLTYITSNNELDADPLMKNLTSHLERAYPELSRTEKEQMIQKGNRR